MQHAPHLLDSFLSLTSQVDHWNLLEQMHTCQYRTRLACLSSLDQIDHRQRMRLSDTAACGTWYFLQAKEQSTVAGPDVSVLWDAAEHRARKEQLLGQRTLWGARTGLAARPQCFWAHR